MPFFWTSYSTNLKYMISTKILSRSTVKIYITRETNQHFTLLPYGQRYRLLSLRTACGPRSFIFSSIALLNKFLCYHSCHCTPTAAILPMWEGGWCSKLVVFVMCWCLFVFNNCCYWWQKGAQIQKDFPKGQ